jgi:hypothetical protein
MVSKFTEGGWLILVTVPALVVVMEWIHRSYRRIGTRLELGRTPPPPRPHRSLVVVPVGTVSQLTRDALAAALSLGDRVEAVYIGHPDDEHTTREFLAAQESWNPDVRLIQRSRLVPRLQGPCETIDSPIRGDRFLHRSVVDRQVRRPRLLMRESQPTARAASGRPTTSTLRVSFRGRVIRGLTYLSGILPRQPRRQRRIDNRSILIRQPHSGLNNFRRAVPIQLAAFQQRQRQRQPRHQRRHPHLHPLQTPHQRRHTLNHPNRHTGFLSAESATQQSIHNLHFFHSEQDRRIAISKHTTRIKSTTDKNGTAGHERVKRPQNNVGESTPARRRQRAEWWPSRRLMATRPPTKTAARKQHPSSRGLPFGEDKP